MKRKRPAGEGYAYLFHGSYSGRGNAERRPRSGAGSSSAEYRAA